MAVAIILAIPITMLYHINKEDEVPSFLGVSLTLYTIVAVGFFLRYEATGEDARGPDSSTLKQKKFIFFIFLCENFNVFVQTNLPST